MVHVGSFLDRFGWVASALVMAMITVASLSPSGGAGDPGSADKSIHILAYAVAALPFSVAPNSRIISLATGIVGWGVAIEMLQSVAGRNGDLEDVAANAIGVLAGVLMGYPFRVVLCMLNR